MTVVRKPNAYELKHVCEESTMRLGFTIRFRAATGDNKFSKADGTDVSQEASMHTTSGPLGGI